MDSACVYVCMYVRMYVCACMHECLKPLYDASALLLLLRGRLSS